MKLFRKADILGTRYSVYRVSSGENEYMENARLDAFEIVLPLLDAMNNVDSNRLDGVEQFIPALMLFHNVDTTSKDFFSILYRSCSVLSAVSLLSITASIAFPPSILVD